MKRFFLLTSALAMLWVGIMLLLNWTLVEWINYTFLFGLTAAIISACINIWQTRFFSVFTRGFRSLGHFIIPMNKSRSLERANQQLANDANLNQFKQKIAQVLFFSISSLAASSIFVSIIGLIFYY
ncbi:DUF3899 domain-containing protein [Viridibacillus sp. FSL R5-0477]|uniref:DUF3899 domain-containing protein n=1 Tax=Viridibacillus arenosi FSL R5-213 TaxID=1227360 RepID=W4EKC3_9BACL|nr:MULTISPECIES: DUF3899 domain-containing protein [Viridibacillus]ETT80995.1 hypothetical protein C176_19809 [Viridibacillus arenosi FSL R5-213]OMC83951.1 hypothetical protein BK130_05445 [Viridibacillus sp. FSL H8-0123]OMC88473.1 hypothetical protein BK128_00565 [Viridibacillus sp. FSL H7-0596]OMC93109.1 hypothetical protein BK137_00875 [Viridibacillus arenosi]